MMKNKGLMDLSHLHALELGLSNERQRLSDAKTESEKALRLVFCKQREKEIEAEKVFLGSTSVDMPDIMSDSELLDQLLYG
jgi:hypothetical protein